MAAAPVEMSGSFIEPTETIIHSIMDLLSLPYQAQPEFPENLGASPFYLLHCLVNEMRPRQSRNAIFEILSDDPSLKEREHYRTLPGYDPPLIGLNLESLDQTQRATLLTKLATHARISPTEKYLGDRFKGDRKGAFLSLSTMDSRLHFIAAMVDDALKATQFWLNQTQVDAILQQLTKDFDLSVWRRETIEKTLQTTVLPSTISFFQSRPALNSRTKLLSKPKSGNQDAYIKPCAWNDIAHRSPHELAIVFRIATQFAQDALKVLFGEVMGGTTAVGGVIHHDETRCKRILSHFNVGDSKLYVFSNLSSDAPAFFSTLEHTIATETETTVQYVTVSPQKRWENMAVLYAVRQAQEINDLRAILDKLLLKTPEGYYRLPPQNEKGELN